MFAVIRDIFWLGFLELANPRIASQDDSCPASTCSSGFIHVKMKLHQVLFSDHSFFLGDFFQENDTFVATNYLKATF